MRGSQWKVQFIMSAFRAEPFRSNNLIWDTVFGCTGVVENQLALNG